MSWQDGCPQLEVLFDASRRGLQSLSEEQVRLTRQPWGLKSLSPFPKAATTTARISSNTENRTSGHPAVPPPLPRPGTRHTAVSS